MEQPKHLAIGYGAESFIYGIETHLRIGEWAQCRERRTNLASSKWPMNDPAKMKDFRKEHNCMFLIIIIKKNGCKKIKIR